MRMMGENEMGYGGGEYYNYDSWVVPPEYGYGAGSGAGGVGGVDASYQYRQSQYEEDYRYGSYA